MSDKQEVRFASIYELYASFCSDKKREKDLQDVIRRGYSENPDFPYSSESLKKFWFNKKKRDELKGLQSELGQVKGSYEKKEKEIIKLGSFSPLGAIGFLANVASIVEDDEYTAEPILAIEESNELCHVWKRNILGQMAYTAEVSLVERKHKFGVIAKKAEATSIKEEAFVGNVCTPEQAKAMLTGDHFALIRFECYNGQIRLMNSIDNGLNVMMMFNTFPYLDAVVVDLMNVKYQHPELSEKEAFDTILEGLHSHYNKEKKQDAGGPMEGVDVTTQSHDIEPVNEAVPQKEFKVY